MIGQKEFAGLRAMGYTRAAVYEECLADLETPLSIYLKTANEKGTFLLESVDGSGRFSRYSFIGLRAAAEIRVRIVPEGAMVRIDGENAEPERLCADPFAFIQDFLDAYRVYQPPELPRFTGGLCGFFGYDCAFLLEPGKLGGLKKDMIGMDDIRLMLCEEMLVVDNLKDRLYIVVHADTGSPGSLGKASRKISEVRRLLMAPLSPRPILGGQKHEARRTFPKEAFIRAVREAREHILAGDLMQVQIGQRIEKAFTEDPVSLYRVLRSLNPAPYMFFFHFGDYFVIGSSPEILVRTEQKDGAATACIRPLAGTRARGKDALEDRVLEEELLADPKERAEHLMLIDLARNDIGRIARPGTVKLLESYSVEKYSHVQHIVSHVEGELREGIRNMDVFKAAFPAGTLSGAPKIKAMEILNSLEPVRRGLYGGAVGYLSFSGDMDLAIAIRTGVVKDATLYVEAAAGIVADSVPEREHHETEIKAMALLRAAEIVEEGL